MYSRDGACALKPNGRIVLFCPNRWYPVEQHGIYWGGKYIFGNIPLVNYLPDFLRNKARPARPGIHRQKVEETIRRQPREDRASFDHLWRIRQHHRALGLHRKIDPRNAVCVGKHAVTNFRLVAFYGNRKNLNKNRVSPRNPFFDRYPYGAGVAVGFTLPLFSPRISLAAF